MIMQILLHNYIDLKNEKKNFKNNFNSNFETLCLSIRLSKMSTLL